MSRPRFADNPYYVAYETLLKELHVLIAQGKGDSPQADVVRDRMERPEAELSREERARLDGLSADLYMLQNDEVYQPPAVKMTSEQIAQELKSACDRKDWEHALALFRHATPFFSPAQVAYLRARAYWELGHLDTAYLFMQHASKLDASSIAYKLLLIEVLFKMNRFPEAFEQAENYIREPASAPGLLVEAATVLYRAARHLDDPKAKALYAHVIGVLGRVVDQNANEPTPSAVLASAYVVQALCHEAMRNGAEAIASYDKALQIETTSSPALVGRGLLLLASDRAGAISDFERAVANNTILLPPYLHLAQHALAHRDFGRCIALCQKAMAMTQNPRTLAVVMQWIAISQFELGAPDAVVRANFQAAVNFDPLNERIRNSNEQFERLTRAGSAMDRGAATWERSEPAAETETEIMGILRAPAALAVA